MIEAMSHRAPALCWWMISTVSRNTLRHLFPSDETMSRGDWRPHWPVPLWSLPERNALWVLSWVWDTKEVGVLVECWVAGGVSGSTPRSPVSGSPELGESALQGGGLAPQRSDTSLFTTRAGGTCLQRGADSRGAGDWRVGGKGCVQRMMAPLILLWYQTDAILELQDSYWHTHK